MEKVLEVTKAEYLHDHVMRIKFNTGEEIELDLTPLIDEDSVGIFEPLKRRSVSIFVS